MMNNLPCKNCICFALCNAIYKNELILKDGSGSFQARNALQKRCTLLFRYLYRGKHPNQNRKEFEERVNSLHDFFTSKRVSV